MISFMFTGLVFALMKLPPLAWTNRKLISCRKMEQAYSVLERGSGIWICIRIESLHVKRVYRSKLIEHFLLWIDCCYTVLFAAFFAMRSRLWQRYSSKVFFLFLSFWTFRHILFSFLSFPRKDIWQINHSSRILVARFTM